LLILKVVSLSDDFPTFHDFGLKSSTWQVDYEKWIAGRKQAGLDRMRS
jgi:hypothetical protein